MSPLYLFSCCGEEVEVLQGRDKDSPICPDCGVEMKKLPTFPAKIEIKGSHSDGYKEGYAKDYQRRLQKA